jgi:hypothetical protein
VAARRPSATWRQGSSLPVPTRPRIESHRCNPWFRRLPDPIKVLTLAAVVCSASLLSTPCRAADPALARSRVVTVFDSEATAAFRPHPDVVRAMVTCGLTNLTGKPTAAEAWRSLVTTQDVVGIKVLSLPGPNSGTRPAVVAGVVEGLLAAGLPPKNIVVWDKQAADLRLSGFFDLADRYGIRIAGGAQAGYDPTNYYESPIIGDLVWGDSEFEKKGIGIGRKSFVSRLVGRELTKIINVTPLLNHNIAGVSGNLYSLALGSVDNVARFETDAGRLARALPEIYAMPSLSDHVVLNIVDALLCQYEGSERSLLHYSATLNELRFSRDPVALDTLSLQDLERQRQAAGAPVPKPNPDLYANAAALELGVNDPKKIQVERIDVRGQKSELRGQRSDPTKPVFSDF